MQAVEVDATQASHEAVSASLTGFYGATDEGGDGEEPE